jgi:cell division septum initiation protein DivIVA
VDSIEQLNTKFLEESKKQDLKEYCERQYKEIVRLLATNKKLEDEVEHLKKLLVNGTSIIQAPQFISNEELICIRQIDELKRISDNDVLTLEDSKKLDTYVKVLKLIRSNTKEAKDILKDVNTEDLLKVVETDVK